MLARADGLGRASRSKGKSLDGRRHQANALLWVKSRRRGSKCGCPLCPRKAISGEWDGMSALCQQRKSAVHTWRLRRPLWVDVVEKVGDESGGALDWSLFGEF